MKHNKEIERADSFKINHNLEGLIMELRKYLTPLQKQIQNDLSSNKHPFGFIIGCPRSGTTLLLQWIASLHLFSYPTNLLNRFAYAPYIGAQIQKLLFDKCFDYANEFVDLKSKMEFESSLGKSTGALAANEFQHFFRNYMNHFEPKYLNVDEISQVDFIGIKKGLISIEHAFEKPFVVKLAMLQFNLPAFYNYFTDAVFLFVKRKPVYNMQSLLLAREDYYGGRNIWWSVKPKEFEMLERMDIYHQIAGQVFFTNRAIEDALKNIPEQNKLIIQYEDFCENPEQYYHCIREKYRMYNYNIPETYNGNSGFQSTNTLKLSGSELQKLENAYDYFLNQQ